MRPAASGPTSRPRATTSSVLETNDFTTATEPALRPPASSPERRRRVRSPPALPKTSSFAVNRSPPPAERAEGSKRAEQAQRTEAVRQAQAAQQRIPPTTCRPRSTPRWPGPSTWPPRRSSRLYRRGAGPHPVARIAAQQAAGAAAARRNTVRPSTNQRSDGSESGPCPRWPQAVPSVAGSGVSVCSVGLDLRRRQLRGPGPGGQHAQRRTCRRCGPLGQRLPRLIPRHRAPPGALRFEELLRHLPDVGGSCRPPTAKPGQSQAPDRPGHRLLQTAAAAVPASGGSGATPLASGTTTCPASPGTQHLGPLSPGVRPPTPRPFRPHRAPIVSPARPARDHPCQLDGTDL